MESSTLFACGAGSLLGSFAIPPLSLPLQAAAFGLFVASELTCRHEIKFVRPVQARRYKAWEETLDHAFEHQTGAAQAYTTNRLDWRYQQFNHRLNATASIREKYLQLFTQGHPARLEQTVNVQATPVQMQNVQTTRSTNRTNPQPPISTPSESDVPLLNLNSLLKTPFVLIWGGQGGGKTSLAKRLAQLRADNGHRITVADPHGSVTEWGNWEIVGSGRDFKALNEFLLDYDEDITADYERYSQGERNFDYSSLLIDEFTQWGDRCSNSPPFVKSICSDIRKICRCAIIVSHSDTLAGLGSASGLRDAINRSAVKIELEADLAADGEYIPTGYGWLQYPGKERVRVKIPHEEPQAQSQPQKTWSQFTPEYLEFINSEAWQIKRRQRIELDTVNGKIICQFCRKPCTEDDPPEVDHQSYPPRGASVQAFIDQPLEDLWTLHRSCHKLKTQQSRSQSASTGETNHA